ncbi:MAG: AbrB/MazE/SpoVT family DNA-binding domain-containing protein [Euryarchaeota archaeon]|nr:AbrB/MazE/SpoVT family DNA-binding domain-containing protein [Euryarchaeota archaeon]
MKVVKSGNSLCIRIPAKLARFLGLKEGREILVYPEGAKKAAFEVT